MLVVKDSMILIHLATGGVLKEACSMFGQVMIPNAVHQEVVERGIEKQYPDALVVQKLEQEGYIQVIKVTDEKLKEELTKYGLHYGELEAVTLYLQKKADLIASNDDKVRKLRFILNLNLVTSPEIIYMLASTKTVPKKRANDCLRLIKKTGWFSGNVIDQVITEVEKLD
jgi:predicted nucleic acid-binding protein